jgi:hypothetical protein
VPSLNKLLIFQSQSLLPSLGIDVMNHAAVLCVCVYMHTYSWLSKPSVPVQVGIGMSCMFHIFHLDGMACLSNIYLLLVSILCITSGRNVYSSYVEPCKKYADFVRSGKQMRYSGHLGHLSLLQM